MSMFDTLRCAYPLPAHSDVQGLVYQTKSLDNAMDEYTLRADGTLWVEDFDIEDHSDPNADTPMGRLAGMLTKVNPRPRWKQEFDGTVRFYTDYGNRQSKGARPGWVEFEAVFSGGRLQSIELIEDRVPLDIAAEREAALMERSTLDAEQDGQPLRRM